MKQLWISFAVILVLSFSVLGWIGSRIYQEKPPLPEQIVTTEGTPVIAAGDVELGQNVWQSMGGMELGSIWGHGSYVAPDWTADWLHREATFVLDEWASALAGKSYDQLPAEQQGALRARLELVYRTNAYDPATQTLWIDPVRGRAARPRDLPLFLGTAEEGARHRRGNSRSGSQGVLLKQRKNRVRVHFPPRNVL